MAVVAAPVEMMETLVAPAGLAVPTAVAVVPVETMTPQDLGVRGLAALSESCGEEVARILTMQQTSPRRT